MSTPSNTERIQRELLESDDQTIRMEIDHTIELAQLALDQFPGPQIPSDLSVAMGHLGSAINTIETCEAVMQNQKSRMEEHYAKMYACFHRMVEKGFNPDQAMHVCATIAAKLITGELTIDEGNAALVDGRSIAGRRAWDHLQKAKVALKNLMDRPKIMKIADGIGGIMTATEINEMMKNYKLHHDYSKMQCDLYRGIADKTY